jgi:hypothetical protein
MRNYTMPEDPMILYSYVNAMLRDRFGSLEEFCAANDADEEQLISKLSAAGFEYDRDLNQFR